jgi:hypothetical protein
MIWKVDLCRPNLLSSLGQILQSISVDSTKNHSVDSTSNHSLWTAPTTSVESTSNHSVWTAPTTTQCGQHRQPPSVDSIQNHSVWTAPTTTQCRRGTTRHINKFVLQRAVRQMQTNAQLAASPSRVYVLQTLGTIRQVT